MGLELQLLAYDNVFIYLLMTLMLTCPQAAGPAYIVELAHPAYRGFQAGMYNNFWWLGNILAGWTTYGSDLHLKNSWAWRTPTLVQCFLPGLAMLFILLFPESPRWLIAHGRQEEALHIFAKYHGDGDINTPIVQLQYREVIEQMELYRNENPWWDFRELYNTKAARYRIAMVICMAFFGQWSGNNVVSYFMVRFNHFNLWAKMLIRSNSHK